MKEKETHRSCKHDIKMNISVFSHLVKSVSGRSPLTIQFDSFGRMTLIIQAYGSTSDGYDDG